MNCIEWMDVTTLMSPVGLEFGVLATSFAFTLFILVLLEFSSQKKPKYRLLMVHVTIKLNIQASMKKGI